MFPTSQPDVATVLCWPEKSSELLDVLKTQGRALLYVRLPGALARDAARYQIRIAVSELLSLAYSFPADQLRIPSGIAGPLSVLLNQQRVFLSFAHEDGLSLAGISTRSALGMDVMKIDTQLEWQPLSRLFLGTAQTARLLDCPPEQQHAAFAQAWTSMEACSKLSGDGLHEWNAQREARFLQYHQNADVLRLSLPSPYCGTVFFQKEDA
ncbi:4'-phosphopantetheinyl transferase family protein [Undibacterium sp. SXout7W]|uniref:4'-phosphopantetheinyl transferase family protein n=1 Tax=Undibacterium sp. SXout7W TaxID=3413049 RepID=UPI003BF032E7